MNITSLKHFVAVAEFASFTKASERLFVSQPTLSRQVQDLEALLGASLFVRSRTSLALTPAGVRLLAEAKDIIRRCDDLPQTVRHGADAIGGTLAIGYQGFLNTGIMYSMMKAVVGAHPDVDLVLSRGNPPELRHNLLVGVCDVIFTLRACVKGTAQVESRKVAGNRLQVAVPRTHRLADRAVVRLSELGGDRIIMLEHRVSPLTIDYVTGLLIQNGIAPDYSYYVDNAETALFMVGIGKGITFLHSQMTLDVINDTDAIRILEIEGLDDELDQVLAFKGDSANPLVPLFVAELHRHLRE